MTIRERLKRGLPAFENCARCGETLHVGEEGVLDPETNTLLCERCTRVRAFDKRTKSCGCERCE
jgi:hypothetical protein